MRVTVHHRVRQVIELQRELEAATRAEESHRELAKAARRRANLIRLDLSLAIHALGFEDVELEEDDPPAPTVEQIHEPDPYPEDPQTEHVRRPPPAGGFHILAGVNDGD